MNFVKKSIALCMASLMAGSFAACGIGGDTAWVAQSGDLTVPAGVYIGQLMNQYYTVSGKLSEDVKDPLKGEVDGVPAAQAMTDGAKSELNQFIAVERKFDELGLTLSEADNLMVEQSVEQYWAYIGEAYQANGISKESYTKMFVNDAKKTQLFQSIYGEGGSEAVPESELKEKFTTDFAKMIVIPLTFSTSEDAEKKAESDKKTREMIDKYYKLAKEGKDMEELIYEAQKEATGDTELVKPEKGTSFTFVNKENSPYDQKVVDALFAAKVGEPTIAETDKSIYLFVRYDINENEADFTARKSSLLTLLKGDEFTAKVEEWGNAVTDVTYNDAALKRYTPKKLKMD